MFRPLASRLLRQPFRAFSTARDDAILSDTFSAMGSILPLGESSIASSPPPPPPTTPVVSPVAPVPSDRPRVMLIPPAQDPLLAYLTSAITKNGHRARASRIVSRTLLYIHAYTRAPALPILQNAIISCAPVVRSLNHKRGGKVVTRPIALKEKQGIRFAVKWILDSSADKPGRSLEERLAREIIAVVQGKSSATKKKEDVHTTAMVNRGNMPRK